MKPGDEIAISITGLGTLRNRVGSRLSLNYTQRQIGYETSFENPSWKKEDDVALTKIEYSKAKKLNYRRLGKGIKQIVFVHGLGASLDYWTPLITLLSLTDSYSLHLFDMEGSGLSPTHPLSELTIESLADDILGIFDHAGITSREPAILVAASTGCWGAIRAMNTDPELVEKLILLGPIESPIPNHIRETFSDRADTVRERGMRGVMDWVSLRDISRYTAKTNPLAVTAVRLSLLGQDPGSFAKGCWALAKTTNALEVEEIKAETLIIAGAEDQMSPPAVCAEYGSKIEGAKVSVIPNVGHWHVFENVGAVAKEIGEFLHLKTRRPGLN